MNQLLDRYRHAVAMKSQAEEYRRTAVGHIDSYEARYRLEYWKIEMQNSLDAIRQEINKS